MEGQHIQENVPMSEPLEHEGAGGTYRLLYGPNLFNCLKSSSRIIMYFKYVRVPDGLWFLMAQNFSHILAVSFIDGRNRSTRKKQPTCRKSLTNFIT